MTTDYIKHVANTIREQLFGLTKSNAIFSWGIMPTLYATLFNGMPALKFKVQARLHNGMVIIALNEGEDYYEIYLQKQGEAPVQVAESLDFTQLGDCIDTAIEVGTNKAEYDAFCEAEKERLIKDLFGQKIARWLSSSHRVNLL